MFKNSQDLLYHNLKEKSDPLIPRADTLHSQSVDLVAAKSGNFNFNLGTAYAHPQTQNKNKNDLTQEGELLSFDSEFECGNLERAYLSIKPHE